ncbi:hypothetical protein ACR0SV_03535 [Blautia fusiformis]
MDEKIIKKNAVPVIAAMITALAFSFTGLPMDGNTSVEKMSDVIMDWDARACLHGSCFLFYT